MKTYIVVHGPSRHRDGSALDCIAALRRLNPRASIFYTCWETDPILSDPAALSQVGDWATLIQLPDPGADWVSVSGRAVNFSRQWAGLEWFVEHAGAAEDDVVIKVRTDFKAKRTFDDGIEVVLASPGKEFVRKIGVLDLGTRSATYGGAKLHPSDFVMVCLVRDLKKILGARVSARWDISLSEYCRGWFGLAPIRYAPEQYRYLGNLYPDLPLPANTHMWHLPAVSEASADRSILDNFVILPVEQYFDYPPELDSKVMWRANPRASEWKVIESFLAGSPNCRWHVRREKLRSKIFFLHPEIVMNFLIGVGYFLTPSLAGKLFKFARSVKRWGKN